MRPPVAWSLLTIVAGVTLCAFVAPPVVAGGLVLLAVVLMPRRLGFVAFAGLTAAVNAALMAFFVPGTPTLHVAGVAFGADGALAGAVGALRVSAAVGANLALVGRVPPAVLLDGLHLPRRTTAWLGAVLIAAQDLGRDARGLLDLEGRRTRRERLAGALHVLPALMVMAHRRARTRREALWLLGVPTGPRFAPIVAVTALAVAGRLAFIAIPNVALTYVIVFLGGLVYGPRVGTLAGLFAMALTDLMISGLVPMAFVNAPAMALVGLIGGAMRNADFTRRPMDRFAAGAVGVLATFGFSVVADVTGWLLVPEFRTSLDLLRLRVLAGLAFNALPALTNAVLFATAAAPVQHAFRALHSVAQSPLQEEDGRTSGSGHGQQDPQQTSG